MSKVILMSIQPKWLVKILNGDKTIEIRKSMPKCELPIDVYLYCTEEKPYITQQSTHQFTIRDNKDYTNLVNGKVVAKFTLNKCYELEYADNYGNSYFWKNTVISGRELERKSCLDDCELDDYSKGKTLFAWHIDDLVIFGKPMELSEFYKIDVKKELPNEYYLRDVFSIKQAPQSWQYAYVKEKK